MRPEIFTIPQLEIFNRTIGPIPIRYYGLMYILAFLLGIFLGKKDAEKRGIDIKLIEDYAFTAMISGLIGGRIYYVLLRFGDYIQNPLEIFAVWHGGMAIHGGIIGGFIGTYLFARKHNISFWTLLDMAVAPGILGQAIGRIGNFMNGEIHGFPTFTPLKVIFTGKFSEWWTSYQTSSLAVKAQFNQIVPWGIVFPRNTPAGSEFPNIPVHPAMLYELILNVIGFLLLWFVFRKKDYKKGTLFFIYLIEYSIIRVIVSTFRAEDLTILGIKAPYLISVVLTVWAIIMIKRINKKEIKTI